MVGRHSLTGKRQGFVHSKHQAKLQRLQEARRRQGMAHIQGEHGSFGSIPKHRDSNRSPITDREIVYEPEDKGLDDVQKTWFYKVLIDICQTPVVKKIVNQYRDSKDTRAMHHLPNKAKANHLNPVFVTQMGLIHGRYASQRMGLVETSPVTKYT